MPKNVDRTRRIADLIQRGISKLLREEFKDPRIGMITIASVEVTRDLAHARIYITLLDETKLKETLTILNNATGFFRSHLAKMMTLRSVPRPRFIFDDSVIKGSRISSLLDSVPTAYAHTDAFSQEEAR